MNSDFKDLILFDDVSMGDVLKQAYDNTVKTKKDLDTLITELKDEIDGKADITYLGPILNNYIDSRIKTNDQLLKFIATVQKLIGLSTDAASHEEGIISSEEKEQLMENLQLDLEQFNKEREARS